MFNKNKSTTQVEHSQTRDVLFGDVPFSQWHPQSSADEEPWLSFAEAKRQNELGNKTEAIHLLQHILSKPDLESRHYLQAWHFLREVGVAPTAEAKQVYGVVVEVALPDGLDIVAAYADHTARYFNFSGAAVIWEKPDESLDAFIDDLLQGGQIVVSQIGVWNKPRPAAPPNGDVRINMLTPSGLHLGQAKMELLAKDDIGGSVISSATSLMQQLLAKAHKD